MPGILEGPCMWCQETIKSEDFVDHLERFHVGSMEPRWGCANCDYVNTKFEDAFAHCILEKHDAQALKNVNTVTPEHFIELASQWVRRNGGGGASEAEEGASTRKRPRQPF